MSDEVLYTIEIPLEEWQCEGMFGPCPNKGDWIPKRTHYPGDNENNIKMCALCAHEYNKYWDEMFNDYYRSVL
jgi:hypothetical protein